jgi:hypothetical protein
MAVSVVLLIAFPQQTTLHLAPTDFLPWFFPSYKNSLYWVSNPGTVLAEVFVIFLSLSRNGMLKYAKAVCCHILTNCPFTTIFLDAFKTKETNVLPRVAAVTVKNYIHTHRGGGGVLVTVSET